jgi:LysM domain-containing protein
MVRVGLLGLAIAALAVGLIVVGKDPDSVEALATTVVPAEMERAQMAFSGPVTLGPPALGEVSFERTEDSEYVVADGETLSEIANRFDLSYEILASYNELANPDTLVPGQRILIPSVDIIANLSN